MNFGLLEISRFDIPFPVSTKDLYDFLEVESNYNNWITNKISQYGYLENQDYIIELIPTGGRPKKLYHVTLDVAKELGMVEGNAKGREMRQY